MLSLCGSLAEIQDSEDSAITLKCESDEIILDRDVVTALGLIIAELVSNCYDHAFPNGKGSISVSARHDPGQLRTATLIIRDTGPGFETRTGSKRHGVGLVRRLVEQIRGSAIMETDHGTVWTIAAA